jgi:NTP pyrophosphatase (non-canonical NTP hydrolase)
MNDVDTSPSPAQRERLAILMEECAEVQQVIGKILRHGWRNEGHCNRIALEHELGDLQWIVSMLVANDDVNGPSVNRFSLLKPVKAQIYLHHAHVDPWRSL